MCTSLLLLMTLRDVFIIPHFDVVYMLIKHYNQPNLLSSASRFISDKSDSSPTNATHHNRYGTWGVTMSVMNVWEFHLIQRTDKNVHV